MASGLKRLASRIPLPDGATGASTEAVVDEHGFGYTVFETVRMWESAVEASEWHGEVLSNHLLEWKRSDTVFILGSGPSINQIDAGTWRHIAGHDSIGFNYWLVHEFVPTLYSLQIAKSREGRNLLRRMLLDRRKDYGEVPFLIRGSGFARRGLSGSAAQIDVLRDRPIFYLPEYPIHSRCALDPDLLLRYVTALGLLPFGRMARMVPKFRSTLLMLVALCYQMGYRNMVLCGVDMRDSRHFWDAPEYASARGRYDLPEPGGSDLGSFTDERYNPNTVPRYLAEMRQWMGSRSGVEITLLSRQSVLYPDIPLYEG